MGREGVESDIEDLDITNVVRKDLKYATGYIADVVNENTGSETEDESISEADDEPRLLARPSTAEKLGWSSEEDQGDPYLTFKNRKVKRKRHVSPGEPSKRRTIQSTKGKQPVNAVVGKRTGPRKQRKTAVWRDTNRQNTDDEDPDECLDDENLPEYVKSRKAKFEAASSRLGTAGLKLPPTYNEVYFSDDERMADLTEKPTLPTLKPCAPYKDIPLEYSGGIIPAPIAQWLRDYQVQGVQFLHELFVWQRGGILGDDMGLGKTIQVISFLSAAFGKTGDERDNKRRRKVRQLRDVWYPRVLIICPGTLMENWKAELDRWGWWEVYVYHGTVAQKEASLTAAAKGSLEIVITTYTTYRLNKDVINTVDWDCVVADECHTIKGRQAEITQAMNNINALCRIGLTGTAIQNNYDELWTLLNWCNPGKFGSLASWKQSISDPLRIGQAHDATAYQLGLARRTAYKLVNNLLPQFFLRRMKSLIADQLPKKSDRVVFCPLTDTQADAYTTYLDNPLIGYIRTGSKDCHCGSGQRASVCCDTTSEEFGDWRKHVFPLIITLQKLSNHLALLIPSSGDSQEKQGRDIEHLKNAVPDLWKGLYANKDSINNYANQEFCGKWRILQKLLQFWHTNGDKVLVFSHSVRLLKMLHLLFSTTAYNVSYLDGSMSYEDRAAVVDDFNANPEQFVFLISTRAGGVGLNITSANKVVIVDPNWNPAHDLQAQDRAYRIGQLRDVEVFRLVSSGTIEEIVYARQIYKQQQANIGYTASSERRYFTGVQDNKDKKGEIFGLANLFSYQGEGVVLQDIVNKTNIAESRIGVAVSDIDLSQIGDDDDDPLRDEDAAMKHLAALIDTEEANKKLKARSVKTDPIQAILSNAGVEYTHENSEVIGTSKTEAHISRKAAEDTSSVDGNNRAVFDSSSLGHGIKYKFRPPEPVRKRQFCTMAKTFGFKNATEFALVVEGWTQEQRRNCLEKFYLTRRQMLLIGDSTMNTVAPNMGTPVAASEPFTKDEMKTISSDDIMTDDEL